MRLNPIIFPDNKEHTLINLNSLSIIILKIINKTRETLKSIAIS
jgi:hypothetical protein